jgi:hypothetical protein
MPPQKPVLVKVVKKEGKEHLTLKYNNKKYNIEIIFCKRNIKDYNTVEAKARSLV